MTSNRSVSEMVERLTDALIKDGLNAYRRDYLREYLKMALSNCDLALTALSSQAQSDDVVERVQRLEDAVEYDTRCQETEGIRAEAIQTAGERRLVARAALLAAIFPARNGGQP